MSDNRHYSCTEESTPYSNLSIKELEILMERSFYMVETDYETLREILEVYKERKGLQDTDVASAWEDFQQHYSGHDEKNPLPPDFFADSPKQTTRTVKTKITYRRVRPFLRGIGVAAAFILVFAIFIDAVSFGGFYRRSTVQWGLELLSFSDNVADMQVNENLKDLHDALEAHHIKGPLAPTWIPDGYVQNNLSVIEMESRVTFSLHLKNGALSLVVQIISFDDSASSIYESNVDEEVFQYARNGIKHIITTNKDKTGVYWVYKNYECFVIGDITEEDAIKIIDSVYER